MKTIKRTPRGFSLVEILMSIAVIMVLMAVGVRAFPGGGEGRVLQETAKLAVMCELAAQHAKASNRWVYLFLREDNDLGEVRVTMVAERDGGDPFSAVMERQTSDPELEVLSRAEVLSHVRLAENELGSDRRLEHSGKTYDLSLRFSPTGQVEVQPSDFVTAIRIPVVPAVQKDDQLPLVLEVTSLTAMTQILQP